MLLNAKNRGANTPLSPLYRTSRYQPVPLIPLACFRKLPNACTSGSRTSARFCVVFSLVDDGAFTERGGGGDACGRFAHYRNCKRKTYEKQKKKYEEITSVFPVFPFLEWGWVRHIISSKARLFSPTHASTRASARVFLLRPSRCVSLPPLSPLFR